MKKTSVIQALSFEQVAERFGTPLYVYDGEAMEAGFRALRAALSPKLEIFYSLKANPNIAIYSLLKSLGARAEICSPTELDTVLRVLTPADNILYVGPAKTEA